jgi:hypothetical protein
MKVNARSLALRARRVTPLSRSANSGKSLRAVAACFCGALSHAASDRLFDRTIADAALRWRRVE